jgi:hypothetical protein
VGRRNGWGEMGGVIKGGVVGYEMRMKGGGMGCEKRIDAIK